MNRVLKMRLLFWSEAPSITSPDNCKYYSVTFQNPDKHSVTCARATFSIFDQSTNQSIIYYLWTLYSINIHFRLVLKMYKRDIRYFRIGWAWFTHKRQLKPNIRTKTINCQWFGFLSDSTLGIQKREDHCDLCIHEGSVTYSWFSLFLSISKPPYHLAWENY